MSEQEQSHLDHVLRESQETRAFLETTLASIGDAVITTDTAGRILFANAVAQSVLGWPAAEMSGKPLDEVFRIINEYSRAPVESPVAKVLREGTVVGLANHTLLIARDGTEIPIDDSGAPIRDVAGTVYGTVLVFRDVTARRRAEETSRLLASIVESSDDAIISKDLHGVITSWNKGAERLFGYTAAEAIGQPMTLIAAPDRLDEMPPILARIARGEGVDHYETVRRTKGGQLVQVSLTISPIHDGIGRIVGASKIARDITERKRAEAALQAKSDELRAVSQQLWHAAKLASMGELAASIAHELNNPLATVSLRIESLLAQAPEDDPRRHAFTVIAQEVDRMGTLVANLLQFSRLGQLQISSMDVCEELDKTLALIEYHLRNHQITVVRQFAPGVPLLHADRQQLRQVFLNLLMNASDAMPQGGTLTLGVATGLLEPARPAVVIAFMDTGVGIAPEDMPKVLEPFFTTKPEGQGTGLGLSICQRIVQEHHGTIELSSTVGQGTTIRLTLPMANGRNGMDGREHRG